MRTKTNAALKHYQEAFAYLNYNYETFAMIVSKIGRPVEDTRQSTAFVALDENGKFMFHMNPNFFDTLETEEKAFVVAHEASHVLYDHLTARKDPHYTNDHAYMLATECHVNDALIAMGMVGPDDKVTGESVLEMSTAGMRFRDIYDLIVEKMEDENQDQEDIQNLLDMLSDMCSEHDHLAEMDLSEEETQALDAARNQIIIEIIIDDNIDYEESNEGDNAPLGLPEDVADAANADQHEKISSLEPGNSGDTEVSKTDLAEQHGVEIDFIDFLEKINPELVATNEGKQGVIPQPSFRVPNTRYLSLTNAAMPVWDNDDYSDLSDEEDGKGKEIIVFALDFSGSVDRRMAKVMEKLMGVIPLDKAEIYACTFSDRAIEYIPGQEGQVTAAGGTDFGAVTGFVDRLMEDNPDMPYPTVVIMTDAGAGFSTGSVNVAYQDETEDSYDYNGKMISTKIPDQETLDKYYRWALFDHGSFNDAKDYIYRWTRGGNIEIQEENMYNLSDLVKY